MSVSEPLRLGDKLRQALAEAQSVLESTDLRGKVKLEVTTSGAATTAAVDAAIDRTEADAKKAITGGGGTMGTVGVMEGPLSPTNKLIDAMEKLIKSMEGVPDAMDKPTRRRRKGGAAPDEDETQPGYINPYILQGMVQNPLGTMRSGGSSMLMGGGGLGMKAPGWLSDILGGSSGEFSVGRALGAPTLGGEAGATAYMSQGAIAGSAIATFFTAFMETMSIETKAAKERAKDAESRISDFRMGNAAGISFRGGTWGSNFNQSRNDVDVQDIQSLIASSGVGFGGMEKRMGSWQMMGDHGEGGLQAAVNSALRVGISPQQMGGLLGAGTRSGTIDLNGPQGFDQMIRYLGLIEQWTSKGKDYGLATSEALSAMAHDSQRQAAGAHGLVTDEATRQMLSFRANLMGAGFDRPGVQAMVESMGANPHSDVERVVEMNQFLGNDGQLNSAGEQWASAALGSDRVANMKKEWGPRAGQMIAYMAMNSQSGATKGRAALIQQMRRNGASPFQIAAVTGLDPLMVAQADAGGGADAAMQPGVFDGQPGGTPAGYNDPKSQMSKAEIDLAREAHVITVMSGVAAEFAKSTLVFDNAVKSFNREVVRRATTRDAPGNQDLGHDGGQTYGDDNFLMGSQAP